ncbi:MAG: hypothetical protein ACI9WU_003497 [Myxococcota bacterium]|jgi:hypothetical protein
MFKATRRILFALLALVVVAPSANAIGLMMPSVCMGSQAAMDSDACKAAIDRIHDNPNAGNCLPGVNSLYNRKASARLTIWTRLPLLRIVLPWSYKAVTERVLVDSVQ